MVHGWALNLGQLTKKSARGKARRDRRGFRVVEAAPWTLAWRADADGAVTMLSTDDGRLLDAALKARAAAAP